MSSIRSPSLLTFCLWILIPLCLLVSATSASTSMWGKKLQFNGPPCMWQLHPEVVIPATKELSACLLLRRTLSTEWTGFVYKAPNGRQIQLGIGGTSSDLTVWLFGNKWQMLKVLRVDEWYSICVTWSSKARRMRVYINGTIQLEAPLYLALPQQLPQNGTLTLGVSHYIKADGTVWPESGNNLLGEIGLFRMWRTEWSAMEIRFLGCADGDVVSWDLRQWKYDCPPEPDDSLHCAWSRYKIKGSVSMVESKRPENCSVSPEEITRNWVDSVFPHNISVLNIFVASPGQTCHAANHSAHRYMQQPQDLGELSNSSCDKCLICEIDVNVDPAAHINVVQEDITALLTLPFSYNFFTLAVDLNSVIVLPVGVFPEVTEPPPSISTTLATSNASLFMETSPTQISQLTTLSATTKRLDVDDTAVRPHVFFRVNLTLNMMGNPEKPEDVAEAWVKQLLETNETMTVLNFIIKENVARFPSGSRNSGYNFTFHVQVLNKYNVSDIKSAIYYALTSGKHENSSITIETIMVAINIIEPGNCLEETTSTIYGDYIWPKAFPQLTVEMGCAKPTSERAYRLCKLDIETDMTSWADPDMTNCDILVTISDISNITVTPDNGAEVVNIIQDLVTIQLGNNSQLSSSELVSVVEKLHEVVDVSVIMSDCAADVVSIIADILLSETDVTPVANNVLDLTERLGNSMEFLSESASITAPSLALSMVNVDPDEFQGLTFGASLSSTMNPEIFVNQSFANDSLLETNATISLPSELNNFFPTGARNRTRVQFHFYATPDLFQDPRIANGTQSNWALNSYVISASINNSNVMNLGDPVVITLNHHNPKQPEDKVQCMFWDFQMNSGLGGWNSNGCETRSISPLQTRCLCDHLTHFAVLLDVSRAPISEADSYILKILSYVGCGISSIFLGLTLLTYLVFEKLRQDNPSKILINLSAALLGLSMLFLLNSWLSSFSNYGLCISTAAALHYFLLASFTWMGLEAVHMYFALVKVFNTYVPAYIFKFCAVGWGIPLVIVSLVLAIDKDAYGSSHPEPTAVALQSPELFCWLQDDVFFYVTVVAFLLLILLCNISMFIIVLVQIKKMKANKKSEKRLSTLQDLRAIVSLTVLLGLMWSMGFFSFGPGRVVMMYLFTICNTLQGFFVFLFYCLMKENVRKQWRMYLCCGRFKFSENSAWSQSLVVSSRCKKGNLGNSVTSENTSSLKSLTPPESQHHNRPTRGQERPSA